MRRASTICRSNDHVGSYSNLTESMVGFQGTRAQNLTSIDHSMRRPPPLKISLGSPFCDRETLDAVVNALQNDRYVSGENVAKFEQEFAGYIGTDYAVSTNSGTSAL